MPDTITPSKGAIVRVEGTDHEMTAIASVNAEALAAREEAQLKAQVGLALRFPRTTEHFEKLVLHECERFGFAEKARYSLPRSTTENGQRVTKSITGWTVRFAETAMRLYRNLRVRQIVVSEDREQRVIEVEVFDLESVVTDSRQMVISKTVERRWKNDRDTVLGERRTSTGEIVYIIAASEADMLAKTMGMVSRLRRNLILEMVPADVLARCEEQVLKTIAAQVKTDPDAHKKRLIAAFEALGVSARQLHEYLGKPLSELGAREESKDFAELLGIYNALKSNETTWQEVMTEKGGVQAPPELKASPPKDAKPVAPTAPSEGFTFKQKPGTAEYTDAVQAEIKFAVSRDVLRQLAPHVAQVSKDYRKATEKMYEEKDAEFAKGGSK